MHLSKTLFILTSLFLASCSGQPSESDAEEVLSDEILVNSDDRFELIDFTKKNATENSFMGFENYTIQYEAELQVKEHCWTYINRSGMGRYFPDFKTYTKPPEFIPSMNRVAVECDKGTKVKFTGEVVYTNTENGWVAQSGSSVF